MSVLNDVKPGDKIAVPHHSFGSMMHYKIFTVDRVTKTQVICQDKRFRKRNGYLIGSDNGARWNSGRSYAEPLTDDIIKSNTDYQQYQRHRQIKAEVIGALDNYDYSVEVLERIKAIIDDADQNKNG